MALKMPTCSVNRVTQITPHLLQMLGVSAVLLDVDNTLSPPDSPVPFPGTVQWAHEMTRQGFHLVIVSNNFRRRVAPFAAQYSLPFVSFAMKPLPFGYLRALHTLKIPRSQAVIVGDQVYTDIIGANIVGIHSILVTPVVTEESVSFLRRRRGEVPIRQKLKETGRHIRPKE
ncbi:YqeG family HAD IIIA-type phosphatase [Caproicibacterium lactatifermentans]|uniref:YqeG family HAD IIIA-type phosphatase n=1 Tax=Caproicibacterium lactatifermentans TaxID=2666138 RepID=A0A859DQI2_9FIRM|nr:YqeG family HAD IIIA-type phosphatase [Caproicibacterium lactatifermentans]QKN24118.1 YqeG family HAD IIIA-type phosphatase [Caproicibacterium lactatifermentans]